MILTLEIDAVQSVLLVKLQVFKLEYCWYTVFFFQFLSQKQAITANPIK